MLPNMMTVSTPGLGIWSNSFLLPPSSKWTGAILSKEYLERMDLRLSTVMGSLRTLPKVFISTSPDLQAAVLSDQSCSLHLASGLGKYFVTISSSDDKVKLG